MNKIDSLTDEQLLNIGSYTDDKLLNLVNNTIIDENSYSIDEFTGGYVSMTSTRSHTKESYKVALLFGFKNRNSQSFTFEINKDLVYIWTKALLTKIASVKVDTIGMNFNTLNGLMNERKENKREKLSEENELSYEHRTNTHCTPTSIPSTTIPPTSLPPESDSYDAIIESLEIKTFIDMKEFIISNRIGKNGKQLQFEYNGRLISISTKKVPYYRDGSQNNLDFKTSDNFYKYLLSNIHETVKVIQDYS
ncbi:MAG: hypothetical protein GQ474_08920 [Sulfurimonas sp.]|nr:hypothetical protein [Sulfurimonas sp.]